MTDKLQRVLDLEDIRSLKARYCWAIDTKQWDQLRALFAPDARFEGFGSAPDGADADTFVAGVSSRLAQAISVHQCYLPQFVFLDEDRVRGVWGMQDHLEWPQPIALREVPRARGFVGYGHYEEEYRRLDGQWRMCFLRLTRLRIDPLAVSDTAQPAKLRPANANWLKDTA